MASTPTALLASERLGLPVEQWITDRMTAGRSLREISVDLFLATNVLVSHETIRAWLNAAA